jgi:outer membrane protein TolC
MRQRWAAFVVIVGVVCTAFPALASSILQPKTVLESVTEHYPQILAALANTESATAAIQEAEGAFDATIEQRAQSRLNGFYDGQSLDTRLVKPLPYMNSTVYGGYRITDGNFPIYEDRLITNNNGELLLGFELSLLRDNFIDQNRAGLRKAEIDAEIARIEQLLTEVAVQFEALKAYWSWVAAGKRVIALQSILDLMDKRQNALIQRFERGDVAKIFLTENQQNIARRQSLLLDEERAFQQAAANLALYFRDENGQRKWPKLEQLPMEFPLELALPKQQEYAERLITHPRLNRLRQSQEKQEQELALGENLLLPETDLIMEYSDDYGAGSPSRAPNETVAKLKISFPLQRNRGEGKRDRAKAEIRRLEHEANLQEDKLRTELENILITLETAYNKIQLTKQEIHLADKMLAAENERFRKGDSDYFVINLREEALANARINHVIANFEYQLARAKLAALTLDDEVMILSQL